LSDGFEISNLNTNPLSKDTDTDGLEDDSEIQLGTNPLDSDSNDNGILDGDEEYVSSQIDEELGVEVSITGKGDLAKELKIQKINSDVLNSIPALAGPVINLNLAKSFETAQISIPYDPEKVDDPSDLSLYSISMKVWGLLSRSTQQ
jgi:hypothetical protein